MNPAPADLAGPAKPAPPADLAALVASRRAWIEAVLRPWCRTASRRELRLAESQWADLAGDVGARETLWAWAWERFPALCEPGLVPPSESRPVRIVLTSGDAVAGTPDGRRSRGGELWLLCGGLHGWEERGPFALDEIERVEPACARRPAGVDPPPRPITMPH